MLERIRKSKFTKVMVCIISLSFMSQMLNLSQVLALTGGPKQPETQGFAPIGMTDMVDNFTGDFTYNIPLFDVGGYPMNLVYNSGVNMDQEASWVGLGWNITPGAINRTMRGVPDEFDGDEISKEYNIKNNNTYGANFYGKVELFGLFGLSANYGLSYNNYTKYASEIGLSPSLSIGSSNGVGLDLGVSLKSGSRTGMDISPSVGLSTTVMKSNSTESSTSGSIGISAGLSYNSRAGLRSLNINTSYSDSHSVKVKNNEASNSSSLPLTGYSYDYAVSTYTPQINMPMSNFSLTLSGTIGADAWGVHPAVGMTGYGSFQYLSTHRQSLPTFGYMNLQKNYGYGDDVMLDFNREKDGSYFEGVKNLPLTSLTYDVYNVSGQGVGGTYRPSRSDVGYVFDNEMRNGSGTNIAAGVEIGLGGIAHVGVNSEATESTSRSGKWSSGNAFKHMTFKSQANVQDGLYEPFYFRQVGEKTSESDPDFFNQVIKGNNLVEIPVIGSGNINADITGFPSNQRNYRNERSKRVQPLVILKADEASKYAVEKNIISHAYNDFTFSNVAGAYLSTQDAVLPRKDAKRLGHHPSEITTYKADGSKYVYGIPAYNNKEEEVSFAVNGVNPNYSTGLVTYSATENSVDNQSGQDHYFSKTTTPAYAHSYLLTEILSSDYIDADDINGPSIKDIGTYTKFNYTKVSDNYKWRVPCDSANYNEGLKSLSGGLIGDDKASYIYGEKELWYIHSIETKTQVAEFILDDRRNDAYGVKDENGGRLETNMSRCLKEIRIYSIQDKIKNGNKAVPIKTVHFVYETQADKQLCQGIPNSNLSGGGKLTLKEVYFTYGNSKKGQLNSYKFAYGEYRDKNGNLISKINPKYNLKGYDRWGSYMPNITKAESTNTTKLPTYEYPYTNQDTIPNSGYYTDGWKKYTADIYATAWNLTSIDLPSGGIIKVDYEADDYAYVQNKRAMRMFKIVGAVDQLGDWQSAINSAVTKNMGKYLIFKLDKPCSSREEFKANYLTGADGKSLSDDGEDTYFRFNLNFKDNNYEYVPGYAQLDKVNGFGIIDDDHNYGYLKFEEVDNNNVISYCGWNFAKLHLLDYAYNQPDPTDSGILQILESFVKCIDQFATMDKDFYGQIKRRGACSLFKPDRSWVRLYEPDMIKKGGGLRVKQVTISDQWAEMTQKPDIYKSSLYGQEYDYTTEKDGKIISSGVASYEPMAGGDENPFRLPITFYKRNKWVPDDKFYVETPFGESFFPSPIVGYSKVTVKSLTYPGVKANATGQVVNEFYTLKDFPTITKQSVISSYESPKQSLSQFGSSSVHNNVVATQAYMVELNDMHGKQKAQWIYPEEIKSGEGTTAISGVEYKYKIDPSNGQLDNAVKIMRPNGTIEEENVGIDYDLAIDMRESKSKSETFGVNFNSEAFMASIIPFYIPTIFFSYNSYETLFRTAVTTKVINRNGLVDKVIAWDNGSEVETSNLLFDSETGDVLLSEVTNQYVSDSSLVKDKLYSFNYPAHWGYDLMASIYSTIGSTLPAKSNKLRPGDVVKYTEEGTEKKAWITKVTGDNATAAAAIDEKGEAVTLSPNTNVSIVISARKNQPSQSIGNIVTTANPLKNNALVFDKTKILNASAIEYTDSAKVFCECGFNTSNPYIMGTLGNWRPKRSYVYLTNRTQTLTNNNTNIRKDGTYTYFNPFWLPNNGGSWNMDKRNWTFYSEVSLYNPYGGELENRDALGIYSSATFGYNYLFPISVAGNAQYNEIGFDNFEDYNYGTCKDRHFTYEQVGAPNLNVKESHTGRNSIEIKPGNSLSIKKRIVKCPE